MVAEKSGEMTSTMPSAKNAINAVNVPSLNAFYGRELSVFSLPDVVSFAIPAAPHKTGPLA